MSRFDSLAPARLALRAACCSLPRSLPTAGGVTPPADGAECGFAGQTQSPRRSRAVARALVVQRRPLVWPVTASARGRSFQGRVASPIVRARTLLL